MTTYVSCPPNNIGCVGSLIAGLKYITIAVGYTFCTSAVISALGWSLK